MLKCPKCGNNEEILCTIQTRAIVDPSGVDSVRLRLREDLDFEYVISEAGECIRCGHEDELRYFIVVH